MIASDLASLVGHHLSSIDLPPWVSYVLTSQFFEIVGPFLFSNFIELLFVLRIWRNFLHESCSKLLSYNIIKFQISLRWNGWNKGSINYHIKLAQYSENGNQVAFSNFNKIIPFEFGHASFTKVLNDIHIYNILKFQRVLRRFRFQNESLSPTIKFARRINFGVVFIDLLLFSWNEFGLDSFMKNVA